MLAKTTKIGQILEILNKSDAPLTAEEISCNSTDYSIGELYPKIRELEQNNVLDNTDRKYSIKDSVEAESYIESFDIRQ